MLLHYIDLSWRSFKRTPIVTALMVSAIAIGIGITMTTLSGYHMMSMDPIPHKSSRIFYPQLNTIDDGREWSTPDNVPKQLTYMDAVNLYNAPVPKLKSPSFRTGFSVHLNSAEQKPSMQSARVVYREFFDIFEREFIYGSAWSAKEEIDAAYAVVIDESVNEKFFQGKNPVGKNIYLDNKSYRISGVVKTWEHAVKYYDVNNGAFNEAESIYVPFSLTPIEEFGTWGNTNGWKFENLNGFQDLLKSEMLWTHMWVQLDSEKEKQEYENFLMAYMEEQQKNGRFNRENLEFKLRDVNEWMEYNEVVTEDTRILVGLSFMFLSVCVANILGLLLAKFLRRAPEVGVRRALGASKRQIFAQHIVEVSLLGLVGGLLGIVVAQLGLWGIRTTNEYYNTLASMDTTMLLTAPAIALAASFVAGLYPAWIVCKTPPALYLKSQ